MKVLIELILFVVCLLVFYGLYQIATDVISIILNNANHGYAVRAVIGSLLTFAVIGYLADKASKFLVYGKKKDKK